MKVRPMQLKYSSPGKQRGIATILVVVMVGLALTATSLSVMHSVRSTQEKHVAVHAATHAQTGAWTGVEAFRLYLGLIDNETLLDLNGQQTLDIFLDGGDDRYGSLSANNIVVAADAAGGFTVSANIVNIHGAARASSAVGAVYTVVPAAPPAPAFVTLPAALNFQDDLVAAGQITFQTAMGTYPDINVRGDMTALNIGTTDMLGQVKITGNVKYGSQVKIQHLHTNGNVTLEGSAWIDEVLARGSVTTTGGGAGIVLANGAVSMGGSMASTSLDSLSNISLTGGSHGIVRAGGTFTTSGISTTSISAVGNITINGWPGSSGAIKGEGNLACPSVDWPNYTSASVNGIATNCKVNISTSPPPPTVAATNDITLMAPVEEVTVPEMTVNVWALKAHAHYIVEYDSTKQRTKVTVNNVNGVPNGSIFWVGDYYLNNQTYYSYLCTAFVSETDPTSKCTAPATPAIPLCIGNSDQCMTYDATTSKWTFTGSNLVPGIIWFNGSVHVATSYTYNTLLVTGDVTTGGSFRTEAANYGGYTEMCNMRGASATAWTYNNIYQSYHLTNLCNKTATPPTYLPIPTGNIGIAAGGYDPSITPRVYSGGNIRLADNTIINGAVLAGHILKTNGEVVVRGYISASALQQRGYTDNELGGNTTIDLNTTRSTYDPAVIPNMAEAAGAGGGGGGGAGAAQSTLLWSRYL